MCVYKPLWPPKNTNPPKNRRKSIESLSIVRQNILEFCSKVNQIIKLSSPNSMPNFKALAKHLLLYIADKISLTNGRTLKM